jgi:hypothetical protein
MLSRIAEWRIVALPALSSSSSASPAIVVGTSSSDLPSRSAPEGTRSSFVSRTEELVFFPRLKRVRVVIAVHTPVHAVARASVLAHPRAHDRERH